MSKVQIFHHYITDAFRLLPALNHPVTVRFSNFFRLILVVPSANVISEPFSWLLLYRLRKTCLALQYIRMVVCRTAFFIKARLFSKTVNWNPAKMSFQESFDINYYYYHNCNCTFIIEKCFSKFRQKSYKISKKWRVVMYLCKSVNIYFLIYLKFYQNFKNCHVVKLES